MMGLVWNQPEDFLCRRALPWAVSLFIPPKECSQSKVSGLLTSDVFQVMDNKNLDHVIQKNYRRALQTCIDLSKHVSLAISSGDTKCFYSLQVNGKQLQQFIACVYSEVKFCTRCSCLYMLIFLRWKCFSFFKTCAAFLFFFKAGVTWANVSSQATQKKPWIEKTPAFTRGGRQSEQHRHSQVFFHCENMRHFISVTSAS